MNSAARNKIVSGEARLHNPKAASIKNPIHFDALVFRIIFTRVRYPEMNHGHTRKFRFQSTAKALLLQKDSPAEIYSVGRASNHSIVSSATQRETAHRVLAEEHRFLSLPLGMGNPSPVFFKP